MCIFYGNAEYVLWNILYILYRIHCKCTRVIILMPTLSSLAAAEVAITIISDAPVTTKSISWKISVFRHQTSASLAPWGETTGDRWIPLTKGKQCGEHFHILELSWRRGFCNLCCTVCREEAALEMEGHFLLRLVYDDSISYDLVQAASKVLGEYIRWTTSFHNANFSVTGRSGGHRNNYLRCHQWR